MPSRESHKWPETILTLQGIYVTAKSRAEKAMEKWEKTNRFFASLFDMGAEVSQFPTEQQITQATDAALAAYEALLDTKRLELEINARLVAAKAARDKLNPPKRLPPPAPPKADA